MSRDGQGDSEVIRAALVQIKWTGDKESMIEANVALARPRAALSPTGTPTALTDYIKGRTGYDHHHHGQVGSPDTEFVPDEIIERLCLLGPAQAHREKLAQLRDLGINQFALYLMHDDPYGTIEAYGREIIGEL